MPSLDDRIKKLSKGMNSSEWKTALMLLAGKLWVLYPLFQSEFLYLPDSFPVEELENNVRDAAVKSWMLWAMEEAITVERGGYSKEV